LELERGVGHEPTYPGKALVPVDGLQRIAATVKGFEHAGNCRMADRAVIVIWHEVLLADIGDIAILCIFSEQMIKWLIFARAHLGGNRLIPFLAIGEDGINIEDHATKIKHAVAHNIADAKARRRNWRRAER
jgi:hypothetical protein